MSKADEFRQYAAEALRWASTSTTEIEKKALIELARTWTQAALLLENSKIPLAGKVKPEPPCTAAIGKASLQPSWGHRSCVSVQLREHSVHMISVMKARQSSKIRELGDALITAGHLTLDEQANALGLCRSTTWTVLKANHKGSGLSATVINRMLMSPQLPPLARAKIVEYVQEKAAGLHGHNTTQLRRFTARLSIERL
jgi:hypothetical protein